MKFAFARPPFARELCLVIRLEKFGWPDAQNLRQFKQRDDRRISFAAFQIAQILLAESGARLHLFLGETFLAPDAGEVPSNKFTHIHE
ncbi:hypothetical protein C8J36_11446 [Rhizobium sp. PP-F2F-G48]|nr:hypothetical protein C8J36_11446 [Rhizobium sp. PP-F2F-G48]